VQEPGDVLAPVFVEQLLFPPLPAKIFGTLLEPAVDGMGTFALISPFCSVASFQVDSGI
jgi:hypothetical protein